jgi:hypothetical protein
MIHVGEVLGRVTWRSVAAAAVFVVVFMTVLRPARVFVNTQWIYPAVERIVAENENPVFRVELRQGKSYFEVYPLEVKTGWKTKYDFRLEGGLMYLISGVVLLGLGAPVRYFVWLSAVQVGLGLLSFLCLYGGVAWFAPLISVSNLIMKYLSPALCVMLVIVPLRE